MILQDFLRKAIERLAQAGIDQPSLDARLLIGDVLSMDRLALVTQSSRTLTEKEIQSCEAVLTRREHREPVARILGLREFWGLPFALNEATLEPRPDSETLIEVALARAKNQPPQTLLDLGTGTGCLLLALLHEWPKAKGQGIDLSPRAVQQATLNAARLGLQDRAHFQQGSWTEGLTGSFDMILSNPPYIPHRDIETLDPEVRLYDPVAALDGGEDGLDPYRVITKALPPFLNKGGHILFEVGIHQAGPVAALMEAEGLTHITIHKDLGGIERIVAASH